MSAPDYESEGQIYISDDGKFSGSDEEVRSYHILVEEEGAIEFRNKTPLQHGFKWCDKSSCTEQVRLGITYCPSHRYLFKGPAKP